MSKKDLENYKIGRKIAEDISEIMLQKETNEHSALQKWLINNKFSNNVVDKFTDKEILCDVCDNFVKDKQKGVDRLAGDFKRRRASNRKRNFLIRVVASSAAVILLGVFLFILFDDERPTNVVSERIEKEEGFGSDKKPILIIEDGKQINLSDSFENVNLRSGRIQVIGNALKYDSMKAVTSNEIACNKLILPSRCTYNVTLSDGTVVYLNSNSTLEYPVLFAGDSREVTLSGEAFFDVTKNAKIPFVVKTGNTKISVYGTKFNVNAYDDKIIKTSLVSGSVGVSLAGHKEVMLKPQQMMVLNTESGKNEITAFNIYKYEAWLNGFFRYDHEPLSAVLSDLSKWYEVSFEYENKESMDIKINASIDRNIPIEKVIKIVEITSEVRFIKKGEKCYMIK